MITSDYSLAKIEKDEELSDFQAIANIAISGISLEEHPNLLVFPDSFEQYDRDLGKKVICYIDAEKKTLQTNSIVGFVGRNSSRLSIHSRFAEKGQDYFLHYMLQKVAKINLFNLKHDLDEDSVFDFMIYLFPLYLKRALRQGVYKKYVSHHYSDSHVKGTIDVSRHLRLNYPFNGNVAYCAREYDYDNEITQLIRHTLEYISSLEYGREVLNNDIETRQAVSQIREATPTFERNNLQSIINKNIKPIAHPFYCEYTPLQRLCLQILRHEELKYGQEKDEIYGVLIDAAWLWEEYLALVIEEKFNHYLKDEGPKFFLLLANERQIQQIVPDYLSKDKSIVADAKYIPLDLEGNYGDEKATSIYYKTITYMYRFCARVAFLLYPHRELKPTPDRDEYKIETEMAGVNGGSIIKQGLRIPIACKDFNEFVTKMKSAEGQFKSKI